MTSRAWFLTLPIIALALPLNGGAAPDPDAITGYWLTQEKEAVIQIFQRDGKYHGRIAWLEEPFVPEGEPDAGQRKFDIHNPDVSKRGEPILGLELLKNFSFDGKGAWTGGTIYDARYGKTYKCTLKLDGEQLSVRGYIGIPALGKATRWTRIGESAFQAMKEDMMRKLEASPLEEASRPEK